jgi:hypothetical protein
MHTTFPERMGGKVSVPRRPWMYLYPLYARTSHMFDDDS